MSVCYCFLFFISVRSTPSSTRTYTLFPYTTLFRTARRLLSAPAFGRHAPAQVGAAVLAVQVDRTAALARVGLHEHRDRQHLRGFARDRKSTSLKSSH